MGITNGRDLLSSKFRTAIIIDSINTAHFVPIKYPIGDYFFAEINNELYAFDTKGDEFKWRQNTAKSFGFQIFFTDHYKPISSHLKELELILEQNNLPKVGIKLHDLFSLLKLREKKPFEKFDLEDIVRQLYEAKDSDPERFKQYKNVISFIEDLNITEICTPVKRITSFLDESLLATDPRFMGAVKTAVQNAFTENREINHRPITAKKGWLKIAAIILLITVIGLVLYLAYDSGAFEGVESMLSPIGDIKFDVTPPPSIAPNSAAAKYPSPEAAKAAIDRGEVRLTDFPPEMRALISSTKTPVAGTP